MSAARVGLLTLIVAVGGYVGMKVLSGPSESDEPVRARLRDASGLPVGATVLLAGLPVGEIRKRRVGPGFAEIEIVFRKGVVLKEDATLFKKRASLLSGPFLEIDPGSDSAAPLKGKYVPRVIETDAIGQVLHDISEALPGTARKAEVGVDWAEDWRAQVNGPWREVLGDADRKTERLHERMHRRLGAINDTLKRGENIDWDAQKAIGARIDRAQEMTEFARDNLRKGRKWLAENGPDLRKNVDEADFDWSPYSDPIRRVDEGEGTLGRLLNDTSTYDDTVETVDGIGNFVRSLTNWRMRVGLRSEYLFAAGTGRAYVTLRANRGPGRYYYIELETSGRGGAPRATLSYDPAVDQWRRDLEIPNRFRFTFQWAKRLGNFGLRYGIKESTFGAALDGYFFDDRLEVSADVFEFGTRDYPRVKLTAALQLFGKLYILAGLDDVLNPGVNYDIEPIAGDTPQTLRSLYYGRDYFLGATLRFDDQDLVKLMLIGGRALSGLNSSKAKE
jgi:phospholipid/cholesterol/gamma-HCH transport system substrate-binding protein